jgi:putative Mg2+ transporter-C (MgtC) family protein
MDYIMQEYLNISHITLNELALRAFLALLFGLILGLDRDNKNKPIDFRAYMIVALISCILAVLSQELYVDYAANEGAANIDVAKIIAGVMTGIGFLGAGAIIKLENNQVVGTATGASIWAAGGMGLTLGFGYYGLAVVAFLSIAIILIIGGVYKEKIKGISDKEPIKNRINK